MPPWHLTNYSNKTSSVSCSEACLLLLCQHTHSYHSETWHFFGQSALKASKVIRVITISTNLEGMPLPLVTGLSDANHILYPVYMESQRKVTGHSTVKTFYLSLSISLSNYYHYHNLYLMPEYTEAKASFFNISHRTLELMVVKKCV